MKLTNFQKTCENEISKELINIGKELQNRKIQGIHEKYVEAEISDTNLKVYIYEDEVGILGPKIDIRFETPDYCSSNSMISAFVLKTLELINN